MRRDKIIGLSLIIIGFTVTPFYLMLVFYPGQVLGFLGFPVDFNTGWEMRIYCALIPVVIGVTFILVAGTWMGLNALMSTSKKDNTNAN